jgi:hypothetical protein
MVLNSRRLIRPKVANGARNSRHSRAPLALPPEHTKDTVIMNTRIRSKFTLSSLWMMRALFVIWLALLGSLPAASRTSTHPRRPESKSSSMPVYKALELAIKRLQSTHKLYRRDYRIEASKDGDSWKFYFVFLPETPDLELYVDVGPQGEVKVRPLL